MEEGRRSGGLLFACIFHLILSPSRSMKRSLLHRILLLPLALAALSVLPIPTGRPAEADSNPPLRFTFLSLDYGEATIVQAPGGSTALVGAGASGDTDAILAALKRRGIASLEPLVLLTWEERQLGGALDLVRRFKCRQVIHNPIYQETPLSRKFYTAARQMDSDHKLVFASPTPGQSFTAFYSPPCQMTFVGPTGPMIARYRRTGCSLAMGYDYDRFTGMFLGDLSRDQQRVLWSQLDAKPRAELLVLGRSGDPESLLETLLKPLRTRIAVIPVAKKGPRPAASTLEALRKSGIRIYRTDRDGTVTVTTTGNGMTVKTHSL